MNDLLLQQQNLIAAKRLGLITWEQYFTVWLDLQKNGDMDYKCFDDKNEIVFMNHTGDQVAPSYSDAKKIVQSVNCHYELVEALRKTTEMLSYTNEFTKKIRLENQELLTRAKGEV